MFFHSIEYYTKVPQKRGFRVWASNTDPDSTSWIHLPPVVFFQSHLSFAFEVQISRIGPLVLGKTLAFGIFPTGHSGRHITWVTNWSFLAVPPRRHWKSIKSQDDNFIIINEPYLSFLLRGWNSRSWSSIGEGKSWLDYYLGESIFLNNIILKEEAMVGVAIHLSGFLSQLHSLVNSLSRKFHPKTIQVCHCFGCVMGWWCLGRKDPWS